MGLWCCCMRAAVEPSCCCIGFVKPAAPLRHPCVPLQPGPCRPRSPAYYTLHFNGDVARSILDAELAAQQAQQGGVSSSWLAGSRASGSAVQQAQQAQQALRSYPIPATTSSSSLDSLDGGEAASDGPAAAQQEQQARRILIGHSMGAAATAEELISNPEGVEAVVLVAPAIVALWFGPPPQPSGNAVGTGGLGGRRGNHAASSPAATLAALQLTRAAAPQPQEHLCTAEPCPRRPGCR